MTGWGGLLVVAVAVAGPLSAQQLTRAGGTVERPGTSAPVPVGNARTVLHRVGVASQGPIDTVMTDAAGRFQFEFRADSASSYLISARHAGIEYFSAPLGTNRVRPDTGIHLLVYDTSATAPVVTKSRTLVLGAPDVTGSRTVIDWFVLENRGTRTRVGRDSTESTWAARLPAGVRGPEVGDARLSQISAEAVTFRDDTAFVSAPISPGQKELLIQYEVVKDQRSLELPLGQVDSVDLFIEETGLGPDPARWRVRDSQMFEGRPFRRFQRLGLVPTLTIRFPRTSLPRAVLPVLVSLIGVGLFGGAWVLMRRPGLARPASPS